MQCIKINAPVKDLNTFPLKSNFWVTLFYFAARITFLQRIRRKDTVKWLRVLKYCFSKRKIYDFFALWCTVWDSSCERAPSRGVPWRNRISHGTFIFLNRAFYLLCRTYINKFNSLENISSSAISFSRDNWHWQILILRESVKIKAFLYYNYSLSLL